jgi:hypothetical protein
MEQYNSPLFPTASISATIVRKAMSASWVTCKYRNLKKAKAFKTFLPNTTRQSRRITDNTQRKTSNMWVNGSRWFTYKKWSSKNSILTTGKWASPTFCCLIHSCLISIIQKQNWGSNWLTGADASRNYKRLRNITRHRWRSEWQQTRYAWLRDVRSSQLTATPQTEYLGFLWKWTIWKFNLATKKFITSLILS